MNDQKIKVELTLDEAMALSKGVKYHFRPETAASAREKLIQAIDQKLFFQQASIPYEVLVK